jgi:hypothetical protein
MARAVCGCQRLGVRVGVAHRVGRHYCVQLSVADLNCHDTVERNRLTLPEEGADGGGGRGHAAPSR